MPAYQMGGISQYVLHLLPALAALDAENAYTILHSRRDRVTHLPPGAPNFRRATLWTPCHHRLERWALGGELLPHRLHLLHSPDFIPPAFGARRRVITVHDLNFLYYPQFLTPASRRYYLDQIAWAVRRADHVIADSHHTRHDLRERLGVPAQKATTIHLAANPLYTNPPTTAEVAATLVQYALPASFLLFVGTLEPRKNVPTLLRAYHALRHAHGVDLPLVLVGGKGWLNEAVFATIEELDLQDAVRHLTGVPNQHLACLYAAAALLALPSFYEGFGLPALEAMHIGCPVIASNRASLPEVVGNAGILLDPDDVDGWCEAMRRVVEDEECRQSLIARGRQQARKFTWTQTAAATLNIYRTLT
ncbi:MAG: glycosyltransferase family 4 protein [Anaerolineales bacterium]|nr:glycosyltransferase family 4 protein [Anaerolineales bacterium]